MLRMNILPGYPPVSGLGLKGYRWLLTPNEALKVEGDLSNVLFERLKLIYIF